jgi:hypothetical protein
MNFCAYGIRPEGKVLCCAALMKERCCRATKSGVTAGEGEPNPFSASSVH